MIAKLFILRPPLKCYSFRIIRMPSQRNGEIVRSVPLTVVRHYLIPAGCSPTQGLLVRFPACLYHLVGFLP